MLGDSAVHPEVCELPTRDVHPSLGTLDPSRDSGGPSGAIIHAAGVDDPDKLPADLLDSVATRGPAVERRGGWSR